MQRKDLRKLSDKFGVQSLSDAELLALIFRHGTRAVSVFDTADECTPYLWQFLANDMTESRFIESIQRNTRLPASLQKVFLAVCVLAKRAAAPQMATVLEYSSPAVIAQRYQSLASKKYERVYGLYLDSRLRVVREKLLAKGSTDLVYIEPRDIMYFAIRYQTRSFVLVHNHPSGDFAPSEQDRQLTKRVRDAADLLQLQCLDHIILARHGYYSFREHHDVL
jgi:DNA repair protein RadC